MPVDEQKTMNKAENHARLAIIMPVQTNVSHELIYDAERDKYMIPKCFSCPGNSKELSNKTRCKHTI